MDIGLAVFLSAGKFLHVVFNGDVEVALHGIDSRAFTGEALLHDKCAGLCHDETVHVIAVGADIFEYVPAYRKAIRCEFCAYLGRYGLTRHFYLVRGISQYLQHLLITGHTVGKRDPVNTFIYQFSDELVVGVCRCRVGGSEYNVIMTATGYCAGGNALNACGENGIGKVNRLNRHIVVFVAVYLDISTDVEICRGNIFVTVGILYKRCPHRFELQSAPGGVFADERTRQRICRYQLIGAVKPPAEEGILHRCWLGIIVDKYLGIHNVTVNTEKQVRFFLRCEGHAMDAFPADLTVTPRKVRGIICVTGRLELDPRIVLYRYPAPGSENILRRYIADSIHCSAVVSVGTWWRGNGRISIGHAPVYVTLAFGYGNLDRAAGEHAGGRHRHLALFLLRQTGCIHLDGKEAVVCQKSEV